MELYGTMSAEKDIHATYISSVASAANASYK